MLRMMSDRLDEIFSDRRHDGKFGGRNVIPLKDYYQLQPVGGHAVSVEIAEYIGTRDDPAPVDSASTIPKDAGNTIRNKSRFPRDWQHHNLQVSDR